MTSPVIWYLNRGSGLVLLAMFTAAVLIGIWTSVGSARPITTVRRWRIPRFAVADLHRNLALVSVLLLVIHVASAVIDEYVDIRWWQSVLPWPGSYRPWYLAAGTLAVDIILAATITALLRNRLPLRMFRLIHLSVYPCWAAAVVHTLGTGTDVREPLGQAVVWGSVALVALALTVRMASLATGPAPRQVRR